MKRRTNLIASSFAKDIHKNGRFSMRTIPEDVIYLVAHQYDRWKLHYGRTHENPQL